MYHFLPYTITHHPPSPHNYITHHHPTYPSSPHIPTPYTSPTITSHTHSTHITHHHPPHTLYNKHINCTSGNALSLRNRAEILFRA